jgi:predicted pyridoxine 5'-phosphate oxidase superfamily flavin-nucleotide-binding protein
MTLIYHSGELAVQARAGVQEEAEALGKSIGSIIKPAAKEFLHSQQLAIASTIEANGRVWASLLMGEPGFMQGVAEQRVRITATPIPGDPLNENLRFRDEMGILAIDLATRRRLRLNGRAEMQPDCGIDLHTQQVYFNCPKYIQARHLDTAATKLPVVPEIRHTKTLTSEQQHWIAQVDTFFIASFHPESGADASHRGGYPGFVRILNASQLVFPDYSGNNMFNTLGNIAVNPFSGLLFIDFEQGNSLQLTGKACVVWDAEPAKEFAGAERLVEFQINEVIAITGASPLRWRFVEYSHSIQTRLNLLR